MQRKSDPSTCINWWLMVFMCRSYKNGYVWNDLGENDVIYPSEGAEYVLKGSELIEGCTGNYFLSVCFLRPRLHSFKVVFMIQVLFS